MAELSVFDIGEQMWQGKIGDDDRGPTPFVMTGNPLTEVTDGIYFQVGFGNCVVVDTSDGVVLIDCGFDTMTDIIYDGVKKQFGNKWIIACIYTHGHLDHVGGLPGIQAKQTKEGGPVIKVYAHKNLTGRFDRYCMTCGYNAHINSKQFRTQRDTDVFTSFIYPHVTYDTRLDLTFGGILFELYHDKGETDDATWVHLPEKGVICPGDFFIWNVPNCGNPQKVQRYPLEWSMALDKMAGLNSKIMLPGHGPVIIGANRVHQALTDTSKFLKDLCDKTLVLINKGMSLNNILFSVKPDQTLMIKPYLRPLYDDPEFIVHNLWRQYCGWWDFELYNLKPAHNDQLAGEIAKLFPSVTEQIDHIETLLAQKQIRLAIFFVEMAFKTNPTIKAVLDIRSRVLDMAQDGETSLMAKSIYYAEKNRTDELMD
jgi:alkyl sulfatase BDS1-like metallo-beta-lactamase superfamily hydrolase